MKLALCEDREYWITILDQVKPAYIKQFTHFNEMVSYEISRATGLQNENAILVNKREYK